MKRLLLFIFILFLIAAAGAGAVYGLIFTFVKPDVIEKKIVDQVERITENPISFQESRLTYFPSVSIIFHGVNAEWKSRTHFRLKAEKIRVGLRMFGLLFGDVKVSDLKVDQGDLTIKDSFQTDKPEISLRSLKFSLRNIGENKSMKLDFQSDFNQFAQAIGGKVNIKSPRFNQFDWANTSLKGQVRLKEVPVAEIRKILNLKFLPAAGTGIVSGNLKLYKVKEDELVGISGATFLSDIAIPAAVHTEMPAGVPVQYPFDFEWKWNPLKQELWLYRSTLQLPVARTEATGRILLNTGDIRELRFSAMGIALENLPGFSPELKKLIPDGLGFSGQSNLEMTLEGSWDHLTLHANMDLTAANLTYAKLFSKPKDLPLMITSDFLLKDGKILNGDFSVRFQEASLKGTFADFNLISGHGGLNLITNKFDLAGWEKILIPFQNNSLKGDIKILGNWDGNLYNHLETKSMFNLTLQNGNITVKDGTVLSEIGLTLDWGELALSVKDAHLKVADSEVSADFSIYHPEDHPIAEIKLSAERTAPVVILEAFKSLASEWEAFPGKKELDSAVSFIRIFFDKDDYVDKFLANIEYREKKWGVENLSFDAYHGKVEIRGGMDTSQEPFTYEGDVELDHLNLARFFSHPDSDLQGVMEGNFFLTAHLKGQYSAAVSGFDSMQGQGAFKFTNGAFKTFDLLEAVSKITPLKQAGAAANGVTAFDDVHGEFALNNGKIVTRQLTLLSPDLSFEGSGEVGLDGNLNYRLNVFLSDAMTKKVLGDTFGDLAHATGNQLGPIPILASGPMVTPELQPDPKTVPELLDHLSRGDTRDILRNFLPEDFLLDRRKSS